jgi:rhamnogalacturonyl hydrolase YesR
MKKLLIIALTVLGASCSRTTEMDKMIRTASDRSVGQCLILGNSLTETTMPKTFENGKLISSSLKWWCSGFFPGTCWYSYMLTGNEDVRNMALAQTEKLLDVDSYFTHHDIGFQIMCSAGLAYKNTADEKYLSSIRRAAELLAARYSPVTGVIKSWDDPVYTYPVIIDNMMNLELLTFAAEKFGVPQWKEIAMSHADKTIENHFRKDYSTYHVVDYDPQTGQVLRRITKQGYNDESAWSRGQSWSLYGYTMMYRETGEKRYLEQAEKVAEYLFPLLAERPVPVWDFDAPAEMSAQADASAGAVMAAAYVELSTLTEKPELADKCLAQAEAILAGLCSPEYLAEEGEIGGFLLKHSCGFYLKNGEIDLPLTYADYYFLEALHRYKSLK